MCNLTDNVPLTACNSQIRLHATRSTNISAQIRSQKRSKNLLPYLCNNSVPSSGFFYAWVPVPHLKFIGPICRSLKQWFRLVKHICSSLLHSHGTLSSSMVLLRLHTLQIFYHGYQTHPTIIVVQALSSRDSSPCLWKQKSRNYSAFCFQKTVIFKKMFQRNNTSLTKQSMCVLQGTCCLLQENGSHC